MDITIIDVIMGAGKTTCLFSLMNERPPEKWIYIGVTLDEVERCKDQCPHLKFQQHGRKYVSLVNLVQEGRTSAPPTSCSRTWRPSFITC